VSEVESSRALAVKALIEDPIPPPDDPEFLRSPLDIKPSAFIAVIYLLLLSYTTLIFEFEMGKSNSKFHLGLRNSKFTKIESE
jgi:hypothetical protein